MIINKNLIANISNITDYDLIKDYLFIRVCNLEQNELKDMPHTAIGDLAITYHIIIKSSDTQICSAKITNNLLNAYGITLDQLHEDARISSPKMIPPHDPRLFIYLSESQLYFIYKVKFKSFLSHLPSSRGLVR